MHFMLYDVYLHLITITELSGSILAYIPQFALIECL